MGSRTRAHSLARSCSPRRPTDGTAQRGPFLHGFFFLFIFVKPPLPHRWKRRHRSSPHSAHPLPGLALVSRSARPTATATGTRTDHPRCPPDQESHAIIDSPGPKASTNMCHRNQYPASGTVAHTLRHSAAVPRRTRTRDMPWKQEMESGACVRGLDDAQKSESVCVA